MLREVGCWEDVVMRLAFRVCVESPRLFSNYELIIKDTLIMQNT